MNKYLLITITLIFLLFLLAFILMPRFTAQSFHEDSFILPRSFNQTRQYVISGRLEQEIIKTNNAKVIKKETKNSDLNFSKPFSRDRTWEIHMATVAEVELTDPDAGCVRAQMLQDVFVSKSKIIVITTLNEPLSIGVTDLKQTLEITPENDQTLIKISCFMKLKRRIPTGMQEYVQKKFEEATINSVESLKNILINSKEGITIPLPL